VGPMPECGGKTTQDGNEKKSTSQTQATANYMKVSCQLHESISSNLIPLILTSDIGGDVRMNGSRRLEITCVQSALALKPRVPFLSLHYSVVLSLHSRIPFTALRVNSNGSNFRTAPEYKRDVQTPTKLAVQMLSRAWFVHQHNFPRRNCLASPKGVGNNTSPLVKH
jgi:hypothetical protein